jgi:hypothetical protein
MKSTLFTITKVLFLLLLNSCSAPRLKMKQQVQIMQVLSLNKTFDLVLLDKVSINDVEKYTKYDIYAYSEKHFSLEM